MRWKRPTIGIVFLLLLGSAETVTADCRGSEHREAFRKGFEHRIDAGRAEGEEAVRHWRGASANFGLALQLCDLESGDPIRLYGTRTARYLPRLYLGEALFRLGRYQGAAAYLLEAKTGGSFREAGNSGDFEALLAAAQAMAEVRVFIDRAEGTKGDLEAQIRARGGWDDAGALQDQGEAGARLRAAQRRVRASAGRDAGEVRGAALQARADAQQADRTYERLLRELTAVEPRRGSDPLRSARKSLEVLERGLDRTRDWKGASSYREAEELAGKWSSAALGGLSAARLGELEDRFNLASRELVMLEDTGPGVLAAAARAYETGNYEQVLSLLNAELALEKNEQWRLALLGASHYGIWRKGGKTSSRRLGLARDALRRARALGEGFSLPPRLFPPDLRRLYAER